MTRNALRASAATTRRRRGTRTRTVLVRVVARLVDLAVAEGMRRELLLEAAGLRDVDLANGDARVPASTEVALWRLMSKGVPDPGFAVRAGASVTPREMGLVGYVMGFSATLGAALRRMARYSSVVSDAVEFALAHPDRKRVAIVESHTEPGMELRFAVDYRLSAVLSCCRQITGVGIIPSEVAFTYARPASTLEHRRFFRCPLRFGEPRAALAFAARDLNLPVRQADETLAGYLSDHAEQVLRSLVAGNSIVERVRSVIWSALSEGRPRLEHVASALQLPPRTLQRRLAEERTSLHREVDAIRRAMAIAMLRDREISLDEIAFLLGYAEPSTLFRAFQRWTGQTPHQYRASLN
jgi:AraC-like DNA-binding protein